MCYSIPVVCEAVQFSLLLRLAVSAHETMSHAPPHYLFNIKQNMTLQEKLILNFAHKNFVSFNRVETQEKHHKRINVSILGKSQMVCGTALISGQQNDSENKLMATWLLGV